LLRPTSAIWHFSGRKFGRLVSTPLVLLHACCSKWCLTKASLFSSCSMLVLRCESGIQYYSGRPATGQVSWRAGPRATPNPGLTTESLNLNKHSIDEADTKPRHLFQSTLFVRGLAVLKALNQASTCDPLLKLRLVCLEALVWNDAIPSFIRALAFRIMVAGFRQVR